MGIGTGFRWWGYGLVCGLWMAAIAPGRAQKLSAPTFTLTCAGRPAAAPLQKLYCETRDLTLPAPPAGTALTVDAQQNGGITVRGWAGPNVRVRARVEARAASLEAAKALAAAVRVSTQNHTVRAARTNASVEGWEVSYEVLVPPRTNLALQARNGHLELENVQGNIRCQTTTGNLTLRGVGGEVRGKTTTGAILVALTGPTWTGTALDVSTTNGDVTWVIPAAYAATLLARTTQGRVQAQLNTTRKSLLPRSLVATLGKGGAQLKASTVNGNISVQQEPLPPDATPPEQGQEEE